MAYATLQDVLTHMGHTNATDSALESRITAALPAAKTAIDNLTGRNFESRSATTKTFGVDGYTNELWVPDLVSVTTLKLDDDDDGTFEVTVSASDFELDTYHEQDGWPYEIVRLTKRTYPYGTTRRRTVQIVGTWGWSAVPDTIKLATLMLTPRLAQRMTAAPFGVQQFGDLGAAAIRSTDPDVAMLLGPYVKPQVA